MKCPNCGYEQPQGLPECQSCQVIFEKLLKRKEREEEMKAKPQLEKAQEFYSAGEFAEAANLYKLAAEAGDAEAQYYLGNMYAAGEGVEQSYPNAAEWFRKSAEQGNKEGEHGLGLMHENGYGVSKDLVKAAEWYRKAAEKGQPDAQFSLGSMYRTGLGVAQSDVMAAEWVRKSAESGYLPGLVGMGALYETGRGVSKDYAQAYQWYLRAKDAGNEEVNDSLEKLKKIMTPEQINTALETLNPCLEEEYADIKLSKVDKKIISRMEILGIELDEELTKYAKGLGLEHSVYKTEDQQFVYPKMDFGGGDYAMHELGADRPQVEAELKELLQELKENPNKYKTMEKELAERVPIGYTDTKPKRSFMMVLSGLAMMAFGVWRIARQFSEGGDSDAIMSYGNIWVYVAAVGLVLFWKGFGGKVSDEK